MYICLCILFGWGTAQEITKICVVSQETKTGKMNEGKLHILKHRPKGEKECATSPIPIYRVCTGRFRPQPHPLRCARVSRGLLPFLCLPFVSVFGAFALFVALPLPLIMPLKAGPTGQSTSASTPPAPDSDDFPALTPLRMCCLLGLAGWNARTFECPSFLVFFLTAKSLASIRSNSSSSTLAGSESRKAC